MKQFDNLFNKVVDIENIYLGYIKAKKGKKYRKEVLSFSFNLEQNLLKIQEELKNLSYKHGGYREFILEDSKKRLIKAPKFRDRVVHHAICNIIEPIFEKSFIFDSYACRKNKGSHKATKRLKAKMKNSNNVFYLKCDVRKYFDSVDQDILLKIISKKIRDAKVVLIIEKILRSQSKGIPIGNLTSQLFANIYLNELDQFIKRGIKLKYYFRYMDDFIILSKRKEELHLIRKTIKSFLLNRLSLNLPYKKTTIAPSSKGCYFLGYKIFKNHILLGKRTIKRFFKKMKKKKRGKDIFLSSWVSYAKHADTFNLTKEVVISAFLYLRSCGRW